MTHQRSVAAVLLVAAVLSVSAIAADSLPELKYEKYELPNGLDVILHEDHTIPMVSVNVHYHVGSKNETPGRTGFAHLFEHMMFQGSEHFPQNFSDGIIKYGGTRNGSTSEDVTNYWENMPSNYLEKTLWLEADRMGYLLPAVTQERLDVQSSVVQNEKRQNVDDQPYGLVEEVTRGLLYPSNHPYSWSVIGKMEDLAAAQLDDVHGFFKKYYSPNNASLCIAGDFDPAQVKKWVEQYFGSIPPGPPIDRIESWVPVLDEEIRTVMTDEVELARLYMVWHTPANYAPGDAELDLLANMLTGGKSARLYKTLVYDKQMAQDVSAIQSSMEMGSLFYIIVTANPGYTLQQIEAEVDNVLDDVRINGFTDEELTRTQTTWESSFVRRLEAIGGFGGRANLLNRYNAILGDPGRLLWDRDRYTNATMDGVLSYVRGYLKPDARLVLYVLPQGKLAEMGTGTDMAAEPGPQTDRAFTPPVIRRTALTNGMPLYLVENHMLPLIEVKLVINSGWAADPIDRPGTASLMGELINEGTKSRSAVEISDGARSLGANLSISSNYDVTSVTINTLKQNLDLALELWADVIVNPTFPEEELQRQKKIYQGRIQQESAEAFTVGFKTLSRELYGRDHPYGQPYTGSGTEESIVAIERSDLEKYYRDNFLTENAALIVVGDITLDDAKSRLENVLKAFPKGKPNSTPVAGVKPPEKTKICIVDLPGSTQSTIFMGNLVGSRNDPFYVPATLVNEVLGGGPAGRLYKNLREDKGYTYGAYSFVTARRGQGLAGCYAQVQTEVTKESIIEFLKELRGIKGDLPMSAEELTNGKNSLTKSFPQSFQAISGVASQLATIVTFGLPLDEWATYAGRINGVSSQQAAAIGNECILPDEMLIVVVGDRQKIEGPIRELNLGEIYLSSLD